MFSRDPAHGSIKRDVKKKVLPRPETRCFLEIQPTVLLKGMSRKKFCLDRRRDVFSRSSPRFYQKGCQEKSSASTGDEMFSRDPAHGSIKRDVKKKVLPRPETRCFLEIQPTVLLKGMSRKKFCLDRRRDVFSRSSPRFY